MISAAERVPGLMAREMVNIIEGKGSGVFTTEDSLYIAEVLLKAREAADTGKVVSL